MKKVLMKFYKLICKISNYCHIKLNDKIYLQLKYYSRFGKYFSLKEPQTFNEKLQWLKLFDRREIYTTMVDKYEAKKYVSNMIGEKYIIPTLGIYEKFDDIDFRALPEKFVMKCTHDSGGLIIVKDKSKLNIKEAKKKINNSLKNNYYYYGREWPYKNVKPRIIIEQYMEDPADKELRDYKFFCFNGKFKMMFIASNRHSNGETYFDFFDENLNLLPFTNGHPHAPVIPHMPKNINKMIELSEKLSENIPQIRLDFYEIDGEIFFGEMTLFHWSGLTPFNPEEWDEIIGEWIKLPQNK